MIFLICAGLFLFFYIVLCVVISSSEEKKIISNNTIYNKNNNINNIIKKEEAKPLVPLANKEKPRESVPSRGADGLCVACGFNREGHGWKCIIYFMNMIAEGYQEKFDSVTRLLEDIEAGRQISKLRASLLLMSLKETKQMTESITKS